MTEEAYLNRGATKTATQDPVKVRSSLSRGRALANAQATDLAYSAVQQPDRKRGLTALRVAS